MTTRIGVFGANGRMGRMIVKAITEAEGVALAAAGVRAGSADIGADAGALAGLGPVGVAPTDRTDEFLDAGRDLLGERWPHLEVAGCTLLGISVSDLSSADAVQLGLDLDGHDHRRLDHVLDDVRSRFGHEAVVRASLLGRDDGRSVPMLPDVPSGR